MLTLDLINTVAFGGLAFVSRAVPMVGAFFIDFVNAIIITIGLNIWS